MNPINFLTPFMWKAMGVVGLIIALFLGYRHWRDVLIEEGYQNGKAEIQALWDADKLFQKAAEQLAVENRLKHNAEVGAQQLAITSEIQRNADEELRKVHDRLFAAERMRKPTKLCGKGTPAGTETTSPGSSDEADPETGLLQRTVEADIRELIWETEVVASAARSCQAFVRANGFYTDPPRTETVEPKDPNPSAGDDHANHPEETHDAQSN